MHYRPKVLEVYSNNLASRLVLKGAS